MSWWSSDDITREEVKSWAMDYLYRCDAGLYEIEKEYAKKYRTGGIFQEKLHKDATYRDLGGKLHAVIMLLQDFRISFKASPRLQRRIKEHGGLLKVS